MTGALRLAVCFFIFLSFSALANPSQTKTPMKLKVKKYDIKSDHSVWDKKTGVLDSKGNVDISLFLEDKTTAHIFCDQAKDNKVEGTGEAKGNVRAFWQDAVVLSDQARWDIVHQEVTFFGQEVTAPGHLTHRNFIRGLLEMDFTTLEDRWDDERRSRVTAARAKGIWHPAP